MGTSFGVKAQPLLKVCFTALRFVLVVLLFLGTACGDPGAEQPTETIPFASGAVTEPAWKVAHLGGSCLDYPQESGIFDDVFSEIDETEGFWEQVTAAREAGGSLREFTTTTGIEVAYHVRLPFAEEEITPLFTYESPTLAISLEYGYQGWQVPDDLLTHATWENYSLEIDYATLWGAPDDEPQDTLGAFRCSSSAVRVEKTSEHERIGWAPAQHGIPQQVRTSYQVRDRLKHVNYGLVFNKIYPSDNIAEYYYNVEYCFENCSVMKLDSDTAREVQAPLGLYIFDVEERFVPPVLIRVMRALRYAPRE